VTEPAGETLLLPIPSKKVRIFSKKGLVGVRGQSPLKNIDQKTLKRNVNL
jgi:hypothetical protein